MKLIVVLCFLLSISTLAASGQSTEGVAERAKSRSYPGGVDEDDLKVREQIPRAPQKISARSLQKAAYKNYLKKKSEESEDQSEDHSKEKLTKKSANKQSQKK